MEKNEEKKTNNTEQSPFEKAVEDLLDYRDKMRKATENTEDVKNGDCTPEDEQQEPGYILYNAIVESSIEILQQPTLVELFKTIAKETNEDTSQALVQAIAICMSHSAHNALVLYDNLLKSELENQFNLFGECLNSTTATVKGHQASLEVLFKRVGEIENILKIENFEKENK